ncbi:sigma-54 factor interaction domain-containing protein [Akkermansiaceae bacterium]|nr:sigma-54 factor interaction domain-containing protein [Akkermansiaceae bacterium]
MQDYGLRGRQARRIAEKITQIAPTRATVLIEGESGTGKELVAHALHDLSGRPKLSEEELTQLKRELEEHSAACTGWISPEFQSFIDQLLNELQFSPEMLEVLNLLEDSKYSSAKRGVHKALKKLL